MYSRIVLQMPVIFCLHENTKEQNETDISIRFGRKHRLYITSAVCMVSYQSMSSVLKYYIRPIIYGGMNGREKGISWQLLVEMVPCNRVLPWVYLSIPKVSFCTARGLKIRLDICETLQIARIFNNHLFLIPWYGLSCFYRFVTI